MDADPRAVLRNTFGYDAFRPPQDEVIATLMQGSDALVLMPTGDGALRLTEDCRPVRRRSRGGGCASSRPTVRTFWR